MYKWPLLSLGYRQTTVTSLLLPFNYPFTTISHLRNLNYLIGSVRQALGALILIALATVGAMTVASTGVVMRSGLKNAGANRMAGPG